jgi:hypothetical protein
MKNEIRAEPNQNPKRNPELETHHESTSYGSRHHFRSHDRNRSDLDSEPNTHDETTDQQPPPILRERLRKHGENAKQSREKYHASSTHEVIQWISRPSGEEPGDRRSRVDEANQPAVIRDPELLGERKIRAVGASVVPSLDCGAEGAEPDGEVEGAWEVPLVGDLATEMAFVFVGEFRDGIEIRGGLRYEGPFLEGGELIGEVVGCTEGGDVGEEVVFGDSS